MNRYFKFLTAALILMLLISSVACDVGEIETEFSETLMATEIYSETDAETISDTGAYTAPESETVTETDTETEAESETESETETEAETVHVHEWSDADCKTPKTCKECGETEGNVLGHTGGTATCMGRAICDRCGKAYGNVANHVYDAEVIAPEYLSKPATMTSPAKYFYSCSTCGKRGIKKFDWGESVLGELDKNYNKYFADGNDGEGYLYFTDPHPVNCDLNAAFRSGREKEFETISTMYESSKAAFAICGGDWFNNSNSRESAIAMQHYIREKTTEWFGKCYLVLGNHDYNYQFVTNGTNGKSEHTLTEEELVSTWFSEYGKTYYTYKTDVSRYYVFNSGIDWGHSKLTDLDKEQAAWFLKQLSENDDKHIVLCPHMIHTSADNLNPGTKLFAEISTAYNARETYTYEGVTYDFSQKSGMVEYIIAGHNHASANGFVEGIPYVTVPSFAGSNNPATADFVYADYDARKLYMYRVGAGESREIDLLEVSGK